jgi:hypothetical protein
MNGPHYPATDYNVEKSAAFPDIPVDQLLGKTDDEIETIVLQSMGLAPSDDVPDDMGRANFQPAGEVDQAALHEHVQNLIDLRNIAAIRAGRQRITATLRPPAEGAESEEPESKRAA